jgi:hypothetical protein
MGIESEPDTSTSTSIDLDDSGDQDDVAVLRGAR